MTPLHSTLKRALIIDGRDYVLTLNEPALKLTLKGKRNGIELPWSQLVNGEAALAVALHASLGAFAPKDTAPVAERAPSAKTSIAKRPAAAKPPSISKSTPRTAPARKKLTRRDAR